MVMIGCFLTVDIFIFLQASHGAFDQEGEADDGSKLDRKRKNKVDKSVSNKKSHSGSNQESAKWGNSPAITEVVHLSD